MKYTLIFTFLLYPRCILAAEQPHKKTEQKIEVCNLLDKNIQVLFMPKSSRPSGVTISIMPFQSVFVFTRKGFISISIPSERFGQSVLIEPSITSVIVRRDDMELSKNQKLVKIPLESQEQICSIQ